MPHQDRMVALRDLLELRRSVAEAVRELSHFDSDSEEIVTLTPAHIIDLLEKYLSGTLSEGDVEAWAEALAGRDDMGFMEGLEDLLKQALFELSTPEINEPIGSEMARRWTSCLRSSS